MRPILAFTALLAVSTALSAQFPTDQNVSRQWDRTTEFTSRGSLSGNAGHVSAQFPYGITAGITQLSYVQYVIQDQNAGTAEPWDVGVCGLAADCMPDYANLRTYATNLSIPTSPSGPQAYFVTHNMNTASAQPFAITVPQDAWHHVWHMKTAAQNWTSDGLGTHMSNGSNQLPGGGTGLLCHQGQYHREIPRTEGTPPAQIIRGHGFTEVPQGNPRAIPRNRAWRLDIGTPTPALHGGSNNTVYNGTGCPNPNEGYAWQLPDFDDTGAGSPGRFDNYDWLVEGGSRFSNGVAVVFASQGVLPIAAGVPTPFGRLFIDIGDPLFALTAGVFVATLNGQGAGVPKLVLGANSSPLRSIAGNLPAWHTQALLVKGTDAALTNLSTAVPKTTPKGWTTGVATPTNPIVIQKKPTDATIYVRADSYGQVMVGMTSQWIGAGVLRVVQKSGNNQIGNPVTVSQFTGQRIPLLPPANTVEIQTVPTNASCQIPATYRLNY